MSRTRFAAILASLTIAACAHQHAEEHHAPEAPAQSITHFTERTELFVEFPALVKGAESAFAVHLTWLADFKPVTEGRVAVVLGGGNGPEERFEAASPTVPGIFRPVAKPAAAGERRLDIVLVSERGESRHELGALQVFESIDAAMKASPEGDEGGPAISFLKEQQWKTEFATAPVATRALRASFVANGEIRARADGEARVTAPVAGRLAAAGRTLPELGRKVRRNDALAVLHPFVRRDTDLASLEQELTRARLALDLARRERERLERLLAEEAVPERRVIAARSEEQIAEADLKAAERRLQQNLSSQTTGRGSLDEITVRAPMDGTLVAIQAAPGVAVEQGAELFHVVDLDRLWLEARVPEAELGRVGQAVEASFQVPGFEREFAVGGAAGGRLIGLGGVLDPASRTLPLLFEAANPGGDLRIGMSARVRVYVGQELEAVAVPESVVLDDGAREVAYVQLEGEAFERRALRLGVRDGGFVQVLEGLAAGDRVVTRGAYEVRLAASSSSVPAHGHAH